MPTFKGKDGKSHFSMNPQMGKAMYGDSIPGLNTVGEKEGAPAAGGLEDNGESDIAEVHHGGHPEGNPEPHEGTAYHTIHKGPDGEPKEIRNHEDYESAESHMRECMGEGENMHSKADSEHDNGASDVDDQAGESAVFE